MNGSTRLAMALTALFASACPRSQPLPTGGLTAAPEERYDAIIYAGDSSRVLYPVTRDLKGSISGFPDATRLVVRDSATWRAIWARLVAPDVLLAPPSAEPPSVDFARELIVVAAQGPAYCAWGVSIDTVYRVERSLTGVAVVRTQHALSGCGCVGWRVPAVALRLPLDQVHVIRFAERPPRDMCGRRAR